MYLDDFELREPDDDGDRKLLADVADPGWHVVLVPAEGGTPGWAFSIGLYANYGHPEIVIFGLPPEVAHAVVNGVGEQAKAGAPVAPGEQYPNLLEGVECTFRPIATRWYRPFLGYALWFYRDREFPVLQCLWPDHEQHFPWEPGFREDWLPMQPLLHHEDPVEARAEALLASMEGGEDEPEPAERSAPKEFAIPGDQVRPLATGHGAAFATDMIMVEGRPVGYMYREDPDNDIDSGWRFLAGPESDEYMDEVANIGLYDVNTVANYDPDIIPFLDAPPGSAFERVDGEGEFVEVDFVPPED